VASDRVFGIAPEAALVIRQQLDVLADQLFCWQGLAWPGAALDWEVRCVSPGNNAEDRTDTYPTQTWHTNLRLTLAGLGIVQACLSLTGHELALSVSAPDSAAILQTQVNALRQRYENHGFVVSRLHIDNQPKDAHRVTAAHATLAPARDATPRLLASHDTAVSLGQALIRTAREHGLYVHDRPELVQLLARIDLDTRLPTPLYQAVAELLIWLHDLANHGQVIRST